MLGVLVNVVGIVFGGLVGTIFKKNVSEKISTAILSAIGLCVTYIGISGVLKGENTLVEIVSMVIGTAIGTAIDIDDKINRLGRFVENKFNKGEKKVSLAEGFVSASLLFCIGSMAVVGSLNAGILHDYEMLYTKSLLDMVSAAMLASSLGIGVVLSGASILLVEGSITLLATFLSNVLTDSAVTEMTCVGSLLIVAIGLNLTGISKFKVANYMPAIIFAPILLWLYNLVPFFK